MIIVLWTLFGVGCFVAYMGMALAVGDWWRRRHRLRARRGRIGRDT